MKMRFQLVFLIEQRKKSLAFRVKVGLAYFVVRAFF